MSVLRQVRTATRKSPALRLVRSVGGVLLLVAGLAGLVFPIIPGIPLLLAGVAVLGRDHPLVRPAIDWLGRLREKWRRWRRPSKGHGRKRER